MTIYNAPTHETKAHFSIPSLVAIGCAIASFFVGSTLGLVLAVIAIIGGGIGMLLALAPSIRGGMVSMLSILAGLIGIVAAIARFFL